MVSAGGAVCIAAMVGAVQGAPLARNAAGVTPVDLRVNYLDTPLGIDDVAPSFSWKVTAPEGTRGAAVSCSLAVKEDGMLEGVFSDFSNVTQFVPLPAGLTLKSDTSYTYTVTCGGGSATASFSTGLLEAADWAGAEWIGSSNQAAVLMRKKFTITGEVTRARIFIAVPGYGQVSVNGHDVDGDAGTRTWSQYDIRTLYHTYDVTEVLKSGDNVFGLHIGEGWYGMWGFGNPTAKAVLRYTAGGKTTTVVTDGSWSAGVSPVLMDSEYNGVTYDANKETEGWDTVDCAKCSAWTPVNTGKAAAPKISNTTLSSAAFAPIKVMHKFTAKWMREPSPGTYVFDFTQNIAGWVKLKIKGSKNTTVTLRHAEALMHPPYGPRDGNIYVGNLRSAKATDTYILKGDPEGEEFQPIFTQHGFRYVEMKITGTDDPIPPNLDMLEAINIRSGVEQSGTAAFSDLMLNQVQHNILWGQGDNLMMIPTDCDQRDERLGWTGDSALSADEASLNYDMGAFYHNWARMLDDTSPEGAISCTVPGHPQSKPRPASASCDASWTSVYPSVVHATMKYYGDLEIVKDNWVGLNRFMDNELNRAENQTIKKMFANFGDWVPPPSNNGIQVPGGSEPKAPSELSAGFSFVSDLRNMAEMAAALGNSADEAKYTAAYNKWKGEWHTAWYDAAAGNYDSGHQTAQVLALYIDAPPSNLKAKVLDTLVQNILAHDNHTTCGIIGWRFELDVLSQNGYGDLAYALITQQTYPSFGFEILDADEPATTVWELWDGPYEGPSMNSRNHIMFGAPGDWVYLYGAGLTQAPDSIGFEHVQFVPPSKLLEHAAHGVVFPNSSTISQPLKWGAASKTTTRGTFSIEWNLPVPSNGGGGSPVLCGADVKEGATLNLGCPAGGKIKSIDFLEYGTATGKCDASGFKNGKCGASLVGNASVCVGKPSCAISCAQAACTIAGKKVMTGDPCYNTVKKVDGKVTCGSGPGPAKPSIPPLTIDVHVPHTTAGTTIVPFLGSAAADITIVEGTPGVPVFKAGKYVAGAEGVIGASVTSAGISIEHLSGAYSFTRSS